MDEAYEQGSLRVRQYESRVWIENTANCAVICDFAPMVERAGVDKTFSFAQYMIDAVKYYGEEQIRQDALYPVHR